MNKIHHKKQFVDDKACTGETCYDFIPKTNDGPDRGEGVTFLLAVKNMPAIEVQRREG